MATTTRAISKSISLDDTRRRIERWRETRSHRHAPMPSVLWDAAATAASQSTLGIGAWRCERVSRHRSIRRRVSSKLIDLEIARVVVAIDPPRPRGLMDRQYQDRPGQFMQACRKHTIADQTRLCPRRGYP